MTQPWAWYGSDRLGLDLPPGLDVDVVEPAIPASLDDPLAAVAAALDDPLSDRTIEARAAGASNVTIVVPDGTRVAPADIKIKPRLNTWLSRAKSFRDKERRDALLKAKDAPLEQKLVMFTLNDPEPLLYVNEPIFRNGEHVGEICSGAYGHTVGCAVGMGYLRNEEGVTNDWAKEGTYEIKVEGKMIPATAYLKSPYDPDNQRTRM